MFVRLSAAILALCGLSLTIDVARGETGIAAYYRGGRTASGEVSGPNSFTAAHRTLPFGTVVRVTNIRNGRSATVRINDRGPYGRGRVIDVSHAAARQLGMIGSGTARVRVDRQ
jgi:rare lipoprotein A